jgi:4'-phosphopantetheinyl transferase
MTTLPAHDDWLTPPEAARLASFRYTKRRDEARLGRWTAKQAVAARLGLEPSSETLRELVIRNASDGAPELWMDDEQGPLAISMTDRADWAVCVVCPAPASIGCDLELVEPRSTAFVQDYLTPQEQAAVAAAGSDHDLMANLFWSAKESALKVLRTGLRRDTRSVEVTLRDDPADGWGALTVTAVEGRRFTGWWRRFGDFVLTFAGDIELEPPKSLVDPSPLETALPSHAWMAEPIRPETPHHDR